MKLTTIDRLQVMLKWFSIAGFIWLAGIGLGYLIFYP
jgi:hypothetical protein